MSFNPGKIKSKQCLFQTNNGIVSGARFIESVQAYRSLIHHQLSEKNASVVLFHANRFEFAVRLFALLLEQCKIILPANGQAESLSEAAIEADFVCGQFPSINDKPNLDDLNGSCTVSDFDWPSIAQLVFLTSGSTGESKKVVKSWEHLQLEIEQLSKTFKIDESNTIITTVSHQHIYGLLFGLLWPVYSASQICQQIAYPEHAITLLEDNQSVILISSPAFLSRLVKDNVLMPYQAALDMVYSSGGPLANEDSISLTSQLQTDIVQVYGSTETGGIAYRTVREFPPAKWTTFGNISVSTESSSKRLILSSPYVYEEHMLLDDLAELDESGQFELLGRIDRTIKLEEKRINLTQMETRCASHPYINQCRLIVLSKGRSMIGAVVVLSDSGVTQLDKVGQRLFKRELNTWLSDYYERVTLPRKWRIIQEMPYNEQGKITLASLESFFD